MSGHNRNALEPSNMKAEIRCPYCQKMARVEPAPDYAPIYVRCAACGQRFILERVVDGFQVLRLEDAPVSSDPDRREIEMGMGQEE